MIVKLLRKSALKHTSPYKKTEIAPTSGIQESLTFSFWQITFVNFNYLLPSKFENFTTGRTIKRKLP